MKKSLIGYNTSFIQIDANNCYELKVVTSNSTEVVVEAFIDGEYKNDLLLGIEEKGKGISIGAGFQPNFVNPNDKLSAHKVVSISLRISLPPQKNVQVFGTNCNVTILGIYEKLKVVLNDGHCTLEEVSRLAEVFTQSGNIRIACSQGLIKAVSQYGTVQRDSIPFGEDKFNLSTVTGNIYISKTK